MKAAAGSPGIPAAFIMKTYANIMIFPALLKFLRVVCSGAGPWGYGGSRTTLGAGSLC